MSNDMRNLLRKGFSNNFSTLTTNSVLLRQNEKLWEIMNGVFEVTRNVLDTTDKDLEEVELGKLVILTNCLSDLVAAAHLLERGFFWPAGTVLRGVVENVSLAISIHEKAEVYDAYRKGKYHTPHAVTVAKNFIPEIGKVNGLLSNLFTHEPHKSIGRGLRKSQDSLEIMLIPGLDQEQCRTFALVANIAAFAALVLGETMERCFAHDIKDFYFWEKVDEHQIRTKTTELGSIAKSMAKELDELLKG